MEKVLLLSPWQAEKARPKALAGFDAAMTGSEFCHNELPSAEAAAALAAAGGGKFILSTPIMTDKALGGWERFVRKHRSLLAEVVVNDWGFAGFLRTQRLELSAGRLMMRELALLAPGWVKDFLRRHGIARGEADRPDLAEAAKRLGLQVSWHGGYVFRAVTTYCPFEDHFKAACSLSCAGRTLKLGNRQLGQDLFLAGNAYFSEQTTKKIPARIYRQVIRPAGSGPA
ncbi:MAG: hypothetical protein HY550_12175 [Elusimicrobia bacterium]|nr:hypothetical protein [Elusimicrobiota bacterium]